MQHYSLNVIRSIKSTLLWRKVHYYDEQCLHYKLLAETVDNNRPIFLDVVA